MWFAVQHAAHYIAIRASRSYRKLPPPAQSELDVRVVCIVNSLVSLRTVYIYFTEAWYVPAGGMYVDIVSYRPCLALFISYFIWDVIVCFQFHWGAAFTVHAFASLFGTYSLSYPVSDYHSSYFGGCFECCNMVNHAAAILKLLKKAPRVVAALEYVFVFMFYTVRVAGGTVVSYHWFADIFYALYNGTAHAAVGRACRWRRPAGVHVGKLSRGIWNLDTSLIAGRRGIDQPGHAVFAQAIKALLGVNAVAFADTAVAHATLPVLKFIAVRILLENPYR